MWRTLNSVISVLQYIISLGKQEIIIESCIFLMPDQDLEEASLPEIISRKIQNQLLKGC